MTTIHVRMRYVHSTEIETFGDGLRDVRHRRESSDDTSSGCVCLDPTGNEEEKLERNDGHEE